MCGNRERCSTAAAVAAAIGSGFRRVPITTRSHRVEKRTSVSEPTLVLRSHGHRLVRSRRGERQAALDDRGPRRWCSRPARYGRRADHRHELSKVAPGARPRVRRDEKLNWLVGLTIDCNHDLPSRPAGFRSVLGRYLRPQHDSGDHLENPEQTDELPVEHSSLLKYCFESC